MIFLHTLSSKFDLFCPYLNYDGDCLRVLCVFLSLNLVFVENFLELALTSSLCVLLKKLRKKTFFNFFFLLFACFFAVIAKKK